MKTIIISVLVIVAASIGISNSAYGQTCYPDLPDPILVLEGTEIYSVDLKTFTRYMFDVENYDQFPDEIFTPSPDVDIFDNEGNRLYGFIGLNAPEDLNIIWVAIEVGTEPPPGFYITIVDTECEITYTSNTVSTCYPNLPDPVLALEPEGIEVGSNEIGTFIRYRLDVTNYDQYPVELFTTAPYLPPYNSASRADIDIFDNEGTRLYGFSNLDSPSSLNNIWIAFDIGIAPPSGIYITVYDRACENIYTSNTILIPEVSVPSVTTNPVINISTTTANSGGEVNLDGGLPVTARGVCWSESSPPTTSDNITTNGNGIGSFTSDLTGLTPNKTYYVRAYATNDVGTAYGNEVSFTTYKPDDLQDIDGNYYHTVIIGSQLWMAENLKTIHYSGGTAIPLVTDNTEWMTSSTPAYCWYNNDEATYKPDYGALYNWYTVETEMICPAGWHVPSYDEWHILFDYLGGYNVAGDKLKATGTLEGGDGLWFAPNEDATNEVGFTALPGGQRIPTNGNFSWINYHTLWWSTSVSPYNTDNYYSPKLTNIISNVSNNYSLKETGLSVRCLQNTIPTITTAAVSSITETSAISGGNVTDDGGTTVTARGVCWSIKENPTIDDVNDFFTDEGPGNSTFSSNMDGLLPNTTYFVRAYGVNDIGIAYGNEISFITSSLIDADYLALVDLYNSTDGDNWTRNDNWLTENVDDWYGVVVSGGRVTGLHLNKNNLTGTIPPSIGDLSELAVLDFWTNNLNGPIPSEIGNLSNLSQLYLNSNELIGPIPVEIGQLTNLTYLRLSGNQLSGTIPDEIAGLSSLTILGLGSNQLTGGIPPVLGSMSSLVQLSLAFNPLEGTIPSELGDLDNLEFLILKDNQLSGNIPPEIWGLSNLKQLHVGINNLEGTIPPEIGNLTNLLFLQLYSNQFSGGLPSAIGNLETLIMLNINSNDFIGPVPSEITDLTSLGVINIKDNQFNSLPLLSALTNLDSLIIEENMFTFKDIEPNIGVAPFFTYSPQANIETEGNGTVHLGEEVVFTVNAGGTNSEYQWSKNGDELGMPSSDNTLTISPVNLSDAGDYGCYVTNSVAPDLMLQANPATLDVINAIHVINTDDAGPGSLRYAIEFANTHPGEDGIYFRIDGTGPHTIQLETRLPDIHDPVIIDGYTQGGASPNTNLPEDGMNSVLMIELDGSKLVGAEGQGFIIHSGDCRIRGLVLNRFAHRGISMWLGGGNIIEGNYLGTNVHGTTTEGLGIGTFAIEISGSDNNIIRNNIVSGSGGTDPLESNPGIVVIPFENPGYEISSGNQFFGNYIGTDVTGTLPLPNNGAGISIGDSPGNTVGGTDPADRNIIYGGLSIGGNASTTGNRVIRNYIGPKVTGNDPMGPPLMGVIITGEASANEIGPGNVISGNGGGILIGEGTSDNRVFGNYVGVNALGTVALPNSSTNIIIENSAGNTIGGPYTKDRNVISGTAWDFGILITGSLSTDNEVINNYIGTNAAGTAAIGNESNGVVIQDGASDNIIGGDNLISGNGHSGVSISGAETMGNQIINNLIGTNTTGDGLISNADDGVNISDAPDNIISGNLLVGAGRVPHQVGNNGIEILGATASGNVISNNYIGTNANNQSGLGNGFQGIQIKRDAHHNMIGPNNVISGNMGNGIAIDYGSNNTVIKNVIAGNTNHGVLVTQGESTSSSSNEISQNSIYDNGGLGISLGSEGVTINDENDADVGSNNLQNYPVLNTIGFSPGYVTVGGYLQSETETDYHLEFFANMVGDHSNYGEGETYLGSMMVHTDSDSGKVYFQEVMPVVGFPGQFITATATDPSGNTSEFSAAFGGIKEQILADMQQPFTYKINQEGLPGIRNGDDMEAINNSFATWSDIPTANLVFHDGGTTPERYASAADGINLVTFTDNKFPMPPGVLAISAKTLRVVPGDQVAKILDADIVFNPAYVDGAEYYFGISDGTADSKVFDIESITTHEIGHAMGLIHTGIPLSTMFYALGTDIFNRTLEADDKAWASYRYPGPGVEDAYGTISGTVTYGEEILGTDPLTHPPVAGALVLALNKENFDADPSNPSKWFHTYTDAEGNYKVPVEASNGGTQYYVHIQPLDGDVFGFDLRPGNISAYIYINTIYTDYPEELYNLNDGTADVGDPSPVLVIAGNTTPDIDLVTNLDTEPPILEDATASPTDNNGKLLTRPEFFIYFNEAVDLSSFTAENCYLEYEDASEATQTIGGSYDYFDVSSKDIILFSPNELEYETDHILHVKSITDLKTNVMAEEYIHPKPFRTTKEDENPPKVHQVLPKDGKTGIFITDTILVFFSEPMDETSVIEGFTLSHPGNQEVAGICSLNPDYDMLTFVPTGSLLEGQVEYTITVEHTAADFSGNTLGTTSADNFTSNFRTVATAAPILTYVGPMNGEFEVTVETPVIADFTEPIDRNTVSSETFSLTSEAGAQVNGTFEFLFNDSRVVFRPAESLDFSTEYTIELVAGEYGIYDMSEVRLPLDQADPLRTGTFTTADELTVPFLEYLDPVSGVDGAVVKVAGSGFDPVPANNSVLFNGSEAVVTDATLHTLTTKVPDGAISGSVPVIVNGIESSNSKYFSIIPQSLSPCAEPIENANTGSRARSVAIAADAASAYVTNYWDNTITAIKIWDDGQLDAIDPPIDVGNNPMDIDINPEVTRAYVTNYSSHTVSVINLDKANPQNSYKSGEDISVGVNPIGIAVSPDKKVYVANYESKNISVIDADPTSGGFNHVVSNVNTGARNRSIAISQDAAIAVVTGDNGVNIIQFAESGNYADAIVTNASAGTRTRDAAIRPDAGLAVVTTEDGDVLVIDIYPGSEYFGNVIANANTGSRSRDVAISQDALFVYISGVDPDVVEVFKLTLGGGIGGVDGSSFTNLTLEWHADILLTDIDGYPDGIDPEGLAIDPYGQRLYIVNTSLDEMRGQLKVVRICCGPVAQEKLVGDLFSIIQNLVSSGILNDGLANALTVKLDKALTSIAKGKTNVAINALEAMINHILSLIDEGVLTEEQAYGMIQKINAIIAELEPDKKSAYAFTGVEELELPGESSLGPIYPNPFKHSTKIHYEVSTEDGAPVRVQLSVINNTGQVVAYLVDQMVAPGQYSVEWDAKSNDDRLVADGIYYVRFTAGRVQLVEKAVVIR